MQRSATFWFDPWQAVIWVSFVYFGLRLIFFATQLSLYVPPDEQTHLGICRLFQTTFLIPVDTPASYTFGPVTHQPYLYYWLMARLLTLNYFGIADLVFLRCVNAVIAMVTVIWGVRWIRLLTDRRPTQVLFVILLTNTSMYTVVGASVSYDPLTIAASVGALFYLHRFKLKSNGADLLSAAAIVLAGTLTKKAFLPFAAIYGLLGGSLIYQAVRNGWPATRSLRPWLVSSRRLAVLVPLSVLLALNLSLYGGNLAHFGRLTPAADQVLTVDQAMQNRIYARNRIVRLFREGRRSYAEAVNMAKTIRHPGDRRATLYLLNLARRQKSQAFEPMNRGRYAAFWWPKMMQGLMGIMGHRTMIKSSELMICYHLIILTALAALAGTWRQQAARRFLGEAAFIFLVYALIVMLVVNYPAYRQFGSPILSVQGRYLLPVIVPFYGLVACGLMEPLKIKWLRVLVIILVGFFFIYGDFVYFLQNAAATWYRRPLP